jgi:hypothetical protein
MIGSNSGAVVTPVKRHMTKSAQEVGTLQSMYWIEIRTVPPVKLPLVAVMTIDVAE